MFSFIIIIYFYFKFIFTNSNFLYLILKFSFTDHHLFNTILIIVLNYFQYDSQAHLHILIIFKDHHRAIINHKYLVMCFFILNFLKLKKFHPLLSQWNFLFPIFLLYY